MRAIRGAITVERNSKESILKAVKELLETIINDNEIKGKEFVSILFTATPDLDQVYPAVSARQMGLEEVPLFCLQEMQVNGSLKRCIRVMVYINRDCSLSELKHIYLKDAVQLRPDLKREREMEK
jgi:chorismate mutase